MTKIKRNKLTFFLFFLSIIFSSNSYCQKTYSIKYLLAGKDTLYTPQQTGLKNSFHSREEAETYINNLPESLIEKGFPVASVDSVFHDSLTANIHLYLGPRYQWNNIHTDSLETDLLNKIRLTSEKSNLALNKLPVIKEAILNYYENTGYPFARVNIENMEISDDLISGNLIVDKGRLYYIDSINIYGTAKIKNKFLQKYLEIPAGSIYNNEKLKRISKHLNNLSYLEESNPWNLSMLGTGAILNLYLKPKKSSRVDVLVGFLPGNEITGKTQITADVNLDLKNSLGSGENILVNWQQLQPQSPRLKLGYNQPYILNTNFGIDFSFDLVKRDSAYLQLNSLFGIQYVLSSISKLKVFYQSENSYLLAGGMDTNQVILTKKLPANIDVRSGNFGLGYEYINTDYRLNPRKGTEFRITAAAGIKRINRNNDILTLHDPAQPTFNFSSLYDSVQLKSYRLRTTAQAAQYINFAGNNVIKFAGNAGVLQSPNTFQNELFRIGGYHLLRGFAEESIYANQYAVLTAEYRYLLGINSYFFAFSDGALTNTKINTLKYSNTFLSGGIGLEFETKVGLLNLSLALGKRNDVKFDIRNSSKIHFGYINYF
ncbi:MAG: POTRA domain-containing protein [Ginsengibacter sp.]